MGVHGSGAFAWTFAGRTMEAQATKLQQDLANGDLTNLPDLHATSAGLKAICTWYITAALEQARQCMAGHGYSAYSALPTLVADITVNCTWEGDNTVMLLQTAQVRFPPTRLSALSDCSLACVVPCVCVVRSNFKLANAVPGQVDLACLRRKEAGRQRALPGAHSGDPDPVAPQRLLRQ